MSAQPSAQGTLERRPFPHLLAFVHQNRMSGTLAVWPEPRTGDAKQQDRLYFRDGAVHAARPLTRCTSLMECVLALFERVAAPYQFYEGENFVGSGAGLLVGPIDTYAVLSLGLRRARPTAAMNGVLNAMGNRRLKLRDRVPVARLGLTADERALVEELQSTSASLADLCRGRLPADDVRRVIYLLALIRGLELSDGGTSPKTSSPRTLPGVTWESMRAPAPSSPTTSIAPAAPSMRPPAPSMRPAAPSMRPAVWRPPASPSRPPSSPSARLPAPPTPRGLSPGDEARWNELAELYDRLDDLTHYELLNLAPSASAQQISAAYYAFVKKFHPDRLPTALAPLSRCGQVLFDQLTEANEVLSSSERRAEYDKAVAAGGGTRTSERMMRNVVESAVEFQKADVLVKTRDYVRAMQHLQSALNKNPDEPDYLALYAWLLHLQNPGEGAPTEEMLRSLNRALLNNPRHERAHYYLGVVLKRLQREQEALRHFRSAVELNPYNVDAARELRIAEMRRGSKPPSRPPSRPPRILSKLFGK